MFAQDRTAVWSERRDLNPGPPVPQGVRSADHHADRPFRFRARAEIGDVFGDTVTRSSASAILIGSAPWRSEPAHSFGAPHFDLSAAESTRRSMHPNCCPVRRTPSTPRLLSARVPFPQRYR
jgi:hypothetical protein